MITTEELFDDNGNPVIHRVVLLLTERDRLVRVEKEFCTKMKRLYLAWRKTPNSIAMESDHPKLRELLAHLEFDACHGERIMSQ